MRKVNSVRIGFFIMSFPEGRCNIRGSYENQKDNQKMNLIKYGEVPDRSVLRDLLPNVNIWYPADAKII